MELLIKLGVFVVLAAIGFWRGRRNEAEHWRLIAEQEQAVQDVLIFATRRPPTMTRPMDPVLVTGSVVVSSDFYRLLIASLRKIVGGNYRSYETMLERARRHALVRLKQDAQRRGARMVFNVCFTTSRISDSRRGAEAAQMEVLAYGTAFVPARGRVADSAVHHQPNPNITSADTGLADSLKRDLTKHPFARRWMIFWFVGVAYAMGELLTSRFYKTPTHNWYYVDAPWTVFGVAALALTAWVAWRGSRRGMPLQDIPVLSVLTVPMIAGVLFYAALRINGLTAPDEPPTPYVLQADLSLAPQTPGKPVLRFPLFPMYWQAQKAGMKVDILVVRGWLGFGQYDQNSMQSRYDAFYGHR